MKTREGHINKGVMVCHLKKYLYPENPEGLTQHDLAILLHCSDSWINFIAQGLEIPRMEKGFYIAALVGKRIDEIWECCTEIITEQEELADLKTRARKLEKTIEEKLSRFQTNNGNGT